jgi:hypothetical protein
MAKRTTHIGSSLDDFLSHEGVLEEVSARAIKRVIAWQLAETMKTQGLTKTAMAKRMHTSRSMLDRLLYETDTGLTIETRAGQRRHWVTGSWPEVDGPGHEECRIPNAI